MNFCAPGANRGSINNVLTSQNNFSSISVSVGHISGWPPLGLAFLNRPRVNSADTRALNDSILVEDKVIMEWNSK